MATFTVEQIGQRAKERNPQKLQGFSDLEIGQRLVERNPQLKALVPKDKPDVPKKSLGERISSGSKEIGIGAAKQFLRSRKETAGLVSGIAKKVPAPLRAVSRFLPGLGALQQAGEVAGLLPKAVDKTEQALGFDQGALTTPKTPLEKVGAGLEIAGELATGGIRSAAPKIQKIPSFLKQKGIKEITEKIAPKLTKTEKQIAIAEGRVVRGKEGLLLGRRPDVVAPSKQVQRAAKTIQEEIPNASRLDQFQLSDQIANRITRISQELEPQMQAVKFTNFIKISNNWSKLKKTQAARPEFANFPGSKRIQKQFESFMRELKKAKTQDDLWKIRSKYDSSISNTVKQATDRSAPFTQLQKEMWLENRKLLNDAIKSSTTGLGKSARDAFQKLNDFYTARQNIISKADIVSKRRGGVLSPKNVIKASIGAAGIGGLSSLID